MKFFQQKNESGYIALMSVIIISLILLAFTAVLSMSGYFSRFNALAGEYKRVSLGLAESCVNVALLKIAQNPNYTGDETVPVGTNNCNIKLVSYNPASGYDTNHQKITFFLDHNFGLIAVGRFKNTVYHHYYSRH